MGRKNRGKKRSERKICENKKGEEEVALQSRDKIGENALRRQNCCEAKNIRHKGAFY